jgi:hypothetical protein
MEEQAKSQGDNHDGKQAGAGGEGGKDEEKGEGMGLGSIKETFEKAGVFTGGVSGL